LSANERINPNAMYRIYEEQRMPEGDDVLDEVAAFQRGVALLQRVRQEDPELWKIVTSLPDGIRSALPARPVAAMEPIVDFQQALPGMERQQPLLLPPLPAPLPELPPSPLDGPRPGETVVLFKHGDRSAAYAVGADLSPRPAPLGQVISAMECAPDTPAATLPADTNARVTAAYDATRQEAASRLGRARRPGGDTRLRRYLARELRAACELHRDDDVELRRISILQQIFLDSLPANVVAELDDVRSMALIGDDLLRRLHALRERHRLNPVESDDPAPPSAAEVVRIVCSDGLAEL